MKVKKLIRKLEKLQEKIGDLPVYIEDFFEQKMPIGIDCIELESEKGKSELISLGIFLDDDTITISELLGRLYDILLHEYRDIELPVGTYDGDGYQFIDKVKFVNEPKTDFTHERDVLNGQFLIVNASKKWDQGTPEEKYGGYISLYFDCDLHLFDEK